MIRYALAHVEMDSPSSFVRDGEIRRESLFVRPSANTVKASTPAVNAPATVSTCWSRSVSHGIDLDPVFQRGRTPLASDFSTGSMLSRGPPLLLRAVCQRSFTKRYRRPDGAVLLMKIASFTRARPLEQELRSTSQEIAQALRPFSCGVHMRGCANPRAEEHPILCGQARLEQGQGPDVPCALFVRLIISGRLFASYIRPALR